MESDIESNTCPRECLLPNLRAMYPSSPSMTIDSRSRPVAARNLLSRMYVIATNPSTPFAIVKRSAGETLVQGAISYLRDAGLASVQLLSLLDEYLDLLGRQAQVHPRPEPYQAQFLPFRERLPLFDVEPHSARNRRGHLHNRHVTDGRPEVDLHALIR